MKQFKMLLLTAVTALLMLFVVFIPMRANAATIENGKGVKLLAEGKQFYKFTLDDDSVIQLSWGKNNNGLARVTIYADKNKSSYIRGYSMGSATGKLYVCMKKGTYYVDMYDGNSTKKPQATMKFTWESGKKYSRGNYSLATAYSLKANTIEQVAQIRKYDYDRWYKIKLTKTQKITLQVPYGPAYYIYVFNSNGDFVEFDYNSVYYYGLTEMVSDKKVPAGTYYIMVGLTDPTETVGEYFAFKWK